MHAKFRATVLVLVMPDVSVHVGHVTITCPSCEYDVEQQEVEENKVDEKEELGLRGGSIQTNQDNAEREREIKREIVLNVVKSKFTITVILTLGF